MYGEGGKMENGMLQDGEAQLMMGRMVPILQVLHQYIILKCIAHLLSRTWPISLEEFMILYDT